MPPDAFMFDTSGQLVMQTAIGGAGTLFGPLVGARCGSISATSSRTTLHLGATWKLVLGIVFVLLVVLPAPRHRRRARIVSLALIERRHAPRGSRVPIATRSRDRLAARVIERRTGRRSRHRRAGRSPD